MARPKKKQPPLRVSVRPVSIDPAEREMRIQKAFDVVFDEALDRWIKKEKRRGGGSR
jgi:hypothetical protein